MNELSIWFLVAITTAWIAFSLLQVSSAVDTNTEAVTKQTYAYSFKEKGGDIVIVYSIIKAKK